MKGGHATKTPFADTSGGSSYRQISPNCRRTPPPKAPARTLHRPHARGVRNDETEQQKGQKGCQMGQLAEGCARARMACHQTQVLGRPRTPRPISPVGQTPGLKPQAVEPTPTLPWTTRKLQPPSLCPAQTRQQASQDEHAPHSEFSDRYRASQARAEPVLIYYRAAANAAVRRDSRGVEPRHVR